MYIERGKLRKDVNKYSAGNTTKRVVRTYTTKSGVKTKVYEYKSKKVKGYGSESDRKLVTKSGKTTAAYDDMVEAINSSKDFTNSQKRQLLRQLNVRVETAKAEGMVYWENTFLSHMQGLEFDEDTGALIETKKNRLRYIYNMGGDPDEIAAALGVSKDDLLNERNWSGDTFIPLGLRFFFEYNRGIRWE